MGPRPTAVAGPSALYLRNAGRYTIALDGPDEPHQEQNPRAAMTMHLPHGDRAIVDIRKLKDYCLSPSHPRGRHKARVFREALDIRPSDAAWLRDALLEAARSGEAWQSAIDAWGSQWRLDVTIERHGKSAVIRTIWIMRTGEDVPRFVTCWVL
jgi:hypothetical protein